MSRFVNWLKVRIACLLGLGWLWTNHFELRPIYRREARAGFAHWARVRMADLKPGDIFFVGDDDRRVRYRAVEHPVPTTDGSVCRILVQEEDWPG